MTLLQVKYSDADNAFQARQATAKYPARWRDSDQTFRVGRGESRCQIKWKDSAARFYCEAMTIAHQGISHGGDIYVSGDWTSNSVSRRTTDDWEASGTGTNRGDYELLDWDGVLTACYGGYVYTLSGGVWTAHAVPSGVIWSATVFDGDLYVGVYGPPHYCYKYDGSTWTDVSPSSYFVYGFTSDGTTLWAVIDTGIASYQIFAWNGSSWSPVAGSNIVRMVDVVYHDSTLYAWELYGGFYEEMYYYTGTPPWYWAIVGTASDRFYYSNQPGTRSLLSYDGLLYLASSVEPHVWTWDGANWASLGGLGGVSCLFVHDGDLYACKSRTAVGWSVGGLYRWDAPDWTLV